MDYRLTPDDKERVKLLAIVSKRGLKDLTLEQLKTLQLLVEKKDYSHNKKAEKSKNLLISASIEHLVPSLLDSDFIIVMCTIGSVNWHRYKELLVHRESSMGLSFSRYNSSWDMINRQFGRHKRGTLA